MNCTNCPDAADCTIMQHCGKDFAASYSCNEGDDCRPCDGSYSYTKPADKPPVTVAPPVTCAMVVALGVNNEAVPYLTFATVEEAHKYLIDRVGLPDSNGWCVPADWRLDDTSPGHSFTPFYNDGISGRSFVVREVQHGKPFVSLDLD